MGVERGDGGRIPLSRKNQRGTSTNFPVEGEVANREGLQIGDLPLHNLLNVAFRRRKPFHNC